MLVVKKNYQSWQITKINDTKMISGASLLNLKGLALESGCVVECQSRNLEVAGSNLVGLLHTKVYSGSVNEYQLQLGKQRQVWLIG